MTQVPGLSHIMKNNFPPLIQNIPIPKSKCATVKSSFTPSNYRYEVLYISQRQIIMEYRTHKYQMLLHNFVKGGKIKDFLC